MDLSNQVFKKPKKFIQNVFEMTSDPKYVNVISWTETGLSFKIIDPNKFASEVLPKHFNHRNISSFIRQLNNYGFSKERDTDNFLIYSHPSFIQDRPEKLVEITKKISKSPNILFGTRERPEKQKKSYSKRIEKVEEKFIEVNRINKSLSLQAEECLEKRKKLDFLIGSFISQLRSISLDLDINYKKIMENYYSKNISKSSLKFNDS